MMLLNMLSAARGDSGLLSFYNMSIYDPDPEKRKGTPIETAWEWDFWRVQLNKLETTWNHPKDMVEWTHIWQAHAP